MQEPQIRVIVIKVQSKFLIFFPPKHENEIYNINTEQAQSVEMWK
jgi:hypothetical protein